MFICAVYNIDSSFVILLEPLSLNDEGRSPLPSAALRVLKLDLSGCGPSVVDVLSPQYRLEL